MRATVTWLSAGAGAAAGRCQGVDVEAPVSKATTTISAAAAVRRICLNMVNPRGQVMVGGAANRPHRQGPYRRGGQPLEGAAGGRDVFRGKPDAGLQVGTSSSLQTSRARAVG